MALGTRTKFQPEIIIRSTISAIHKFRVGLSRQNIGSSILTSTYVKIYSLLLTEGATGTGHAR